MNQTLTKHISCECKCKSDGRKCRCTINVDVKVKIYISEYVKYLESLSDDSAVTCNEIRDTVWSKPTETMPINFDYKKLTYEMDNFNVLLTFLLIVGLIIVRIYYYYHIKHESKQSKYCITIVIIN